MISQWCSHIHQIARQSIYHLLAMHECKGRLLAMVVWATQSLMVCNRTVIGLQMSVTLVVLSGLWFAHIWSFCAVTHYPQLYPAPLLRKTLMNILKWFSKMIATSLVDNADKWYMTQILLILTASEPSISGLQHWQESINLHSHK